MRRLPRLEHPGSAIQIAEELAALQDADRRIARIRRREELADFRRGAKQTQATIRLADGFAKLGGG